MNRPIELDRVRQEMALVAWRDDCRARMALRYPDIDFDSDTWRPRIAHGVDVNDVYLTPALTDFAGKDPSFVMAVRCLAAEAALAQTKGINEALRGFRLIARTAAPSVYDLDLAQLRRLEDALLAEARANPASSNGLTNDLSRLARNLDQLRTRSVLPSLRYRMRTETQSALAKEAAEHAAKRRGRKATLLDGQIGAFNEVCNAWADNDPRLSAFDVQMIAANGLLMGAPSRINEPLCMSIDDVVTIDDYARQPEDAGMDTLQAAQQLLLTMKGSKGAPWSAKPVLNFMIEFVKVCIETIKAGGQRSRMLIDWYQKNPDTLYLPDELNDLRGQDISRRDLRRIMMLDAEAVPKSRGTSSPESCFFQRHKNAATRRPTPIGGSEMVLPWHVVEAGLLEEVRQAMADCRAVSAQNHYQGDLSRMLCLTDHNEAVLPYLPCALKYGTLRTRFGRNAPYSIFAKLGIHMPVNDAHAIAWMGTHDPRRWLTTMARVHGEKLSDVLINKWANRLNFASMWHYVLQTAEDKAKASAMPDAAELRDLSESMTAMRRKQDAAGLKTEIIAVHEIGVSVTSMAAIHEHSENRPYARTAEQLMVLYATWFGSCAHQHHEQPCRAYASCVPCNEHFVVKGHLPTNERIRERCELMFGSILAEIERLMVARGQGIADDAEGLDAHLVALVRQGLTPEHMTAELIERFHELKDRITDIVFRNRLEEAFVLTGYVRILDDDKYPSGAQIKYNNPARHASPGLERGMDAHGGRAALHKKMEDYFLVYPEFAPQALGLKDQSHLLSEPDRAEPDGEEPCDE